MTSSSGRRDGLDAREALLRLQRFGPNELPRAARRNLARIALGVLSEPMFLLLVLAAGIYLLLGDPHESLLLAAFAALSVGLVVVQEARSESAIEALHRMAAPFARVRREGQVLSIPAREVVPGDLLLVAEGERAAADGVLLEAVEIEVDESLLTGESVPVVKRAWATGAQGEETGEYAGTRAPGQDVAGRVDALPHASGAGQTRGRDARDDRNMPPEGDVDQVYAGTLVVRGHGLVEVRRTGSTTAAGRIGASLAAIETEPTLLQRNVGRLVRWFGVIAALVSLSVVLGYGLVRGDWAQGLLSGIALAMAMLPEEFPMALAVFLALGSWRMAKVKVLARRPAMVETLGATTMLCLDKTGTLTENRMRLKVLATLAVRLDLRGDEEALPEPVHRLLEFAVLASRQQAHDPMDHAIHGMGEQSLASTEHLHRDWPLQRDYGVSAEQPVMSRIWRNPQGRLVLASKGAPETVLARCLIDADERERWLQRVQELAAHGLRVLAVASVEDDASLTVEQLRRKPMRCEGLVAFADPLRATAAAAIAAARRAGIAAAMITGDYPATALAIATEAGIDGTPGVLSGSDLERMDETQLRAAVRRVRVYARIRPEQKLRLVQAWKANGEVVAMTGDGVNDAPALKAAHIGLAMGTRGTDVAREAAGIVLLEDDIARLIDGIRLGRRIFENLRKVLIYIAAIHIPVAGLALLPLLLGMPPMLLPMHVVLIEMVVDPICSIAFENQPADQRSMERAPRRADEALVGAPQLLLGGVCGLLLLAACFGLYSWALARGMHEDESRTLAFLALTAGNLTMVRVVGSNRATLAHLFERGHLAYWIVATLACLVVAGCMLWPGLAALFGFSLPGLDLLLLAVLVGAGSVLLLDLAKGSALLQGTLGVAEREKAGPA